MRLADTRGVDNLGRTRPTGVNFRKVSIRRRHGRSRKGWRYPSDRAQSYAYADSWRTATGKTLCGIDLR